MNAGDSKQTNKTQIDELLAKYPVISDQVSMRELEIILHHLLESLKNTKNGHIVEFGCFVGTTSLFLQRLCQKFRLPPANLHVYDSFEGLPPKAQQDASPIGLQFTTGKLHASKKEFVRNFKKANLPLPNIHKAWFSDISNSDIPNNICFAFLDGDYYHSIWQSLRLIENKLLPGAIIIVDDYQSEQLPGAQKALDEWLVSKPYKLRKQSSLGIIRT